MGRPRSASGRASRTDARLAEVYPGSAADLCPLDHETPFQLLVATILSAQTTDAGVNLATPRLFARFPDADALAGADPDEVEVLIRSTGFFRQKTKSIIGMATVVAGDFGGEVPSELERLVALPGVGRKTANVVRSVSFDAPGLPVDTHVKRVTKRIGITEQTDPERIEDELTGLLPASHWGAFSIRVILHGRRVCTARRPDCSSCVLNDFCPSSLVTP